MKNRGDHMTAALIIAAGKTGHERRFAPEKAVGAVSAIKRCVLTFQQAGIERVVVVCGDSEDRTEKLVSHMNVTFLSSPNSGEMLDSVKVGLNFLRGKCTAVLITHTNVPLFSVETVQALLAAEGGICVPAYQGRTGHPICVAAELISQILSYNGPGGLAGAIRAAGVERTVLTVEDEGVLAHIQDGTACEQLLLNRKTPDLRPAFRFQLMRDQPFYGPGAHQLLQLTQETGSLLDACRHMGISYSKGRKIISNLEQHMGCTILECIRGGKTGGASTVTTEGQRLIHNYSAFCKEAEIYLTELFHKHFHS